MFNYKEYPDVDEYVIVTITNINPNSAFAKLDEYNGKTGMIHISEVASTWIKDIRKYVSVGNKRVARVLSVDMAKGYINLSLKRVKPNTEREKKTEWKNEKKAENLLSMVAKDMGMKLNEAYAKVGFDLQKKYGLLYTAFEVAAEDGADALIADGVDKAWAEKLEDIAKKNIKPKEVVIKTILELKSYRPDGINVIRDALVAIADKRVKISYINAPKYSMNIQAKDYPEAEQVLKETSKKIIDTIEKSGGEATLSRLK